MIVASIFERRAPGLYHNTAVLIERTARLRASTVKCISRTIPGTMKNTISLRATWGFIPWILPWAGWGSWSAGTSGIRRRRGLWPLTGPNCLSIPRPSGGTRGESGGTGLMLNAWVTIQRSHAIANGLPVISANRVGFEPAPGRLRATARYSGGTA